MKPKSLLIVAAMIFAAGAASYAQSLFGTILGTVTDPAGGVIPAAEVTILNNATNAVRVLQTNAVGNFEAPALPVGVYDISFTADGFRRTIRAGQILQVDQRLRLDVSLTVGEVTETVEITAMAPLIETETASQGTVVDNARIVELPLNGRDFRQLAVLGPGVIAAPPGSGGRFSVAGTRGLSNSFMLDGATNTNVNANVTYVNPSIDLIQEFKVQRNTFNAEYGRGAAQINVVTRSGTNEVRFTLFEFIRNDKIQARNFFDRQKPAFRRNQFGGTVGAPVIKDRVFALFNYEGLRQRAPSTLFGGVPTITEFTGDLSGRGAAVRDPFTRDPIPNKQIPASRINRLSVDYQEFIPATEDSLGTYGRGRNVVKAVSAPNDSGQWTAKGDFHFSQSVNGFVRYTSNDPITHRLGLNEFFDRNIDQRQHNAVAGLNWMVGPRIINEFRASYSMHRLLANPLIAATTQRNFARELGLKNVLSGEVPDANGIPAVRITGFTAFNASSWITQRMETFSWVDNLSYVTGAHTLKFGVDIRHVMFDIRNIGATNGSFAFTGTFSGDSIGDYLLGLARTAGATAPPGADGVNLSTFWMGFVQDDWRVSPKLTLSLGLRYEFAEPFENTRGRISLFDTGFPGGRIIYPAAAEYFVPGEGFLPSETGDPLARKGLYKPDRNNFAPRIGFAWRPFGGNRTVLRGSYGIFTEAPNENNNIMSIGNTPHVVKQSIRNDVTNPNIFWSDLFPAAQPAGFASVSSFSEDLPTGYLQQWSFNIQRELVRNLAFEIGYMGNKGTQLDQRRHINQAIPDTDPSKPTPIRNRVPYPAFASSMGFFDRTGYSDYHSLITRLERQFDNGMSFLAAYTFSKMIDNSSYAGNIGSQPNFPQNSNNLDGEKGLSFFDVPHRFVVSWLYNLPFGKGRTYLQSGPLSHIFGGWQVNGIFQAQSGNPWPVVISGDRANVGAGNQRADVVGDPFPAGFERGGTQRMALNRDAFAIPVRGTFGNSGRNIIRDAALNNWDVGIFKNFTVAEKFRFQFRTEFFNAFNHTQFQRFVNNRSSPAFGVWNSARAARTLQFGLKLIY